MSNLKRHQGYVLSARPSRLYQSGVENPITNTNGCKLIWFHASAPVFGGGGEQTGWSALLSPGQTLTNELPFLSTSYHDLFIQQRGFQLFVWGLVPQSYLWVQKLPREVSQPASVEWSCRQWMLAYWTSTGSCGIWRCKSEFFCERGYLKRAYVLLYDVFIFIT